MSEIALISHASKVMLKILQARLQWYVRCKLPDVQAGFRKGRGIRGQIANILWINKKATELQKNIYFCFTEYTKAFDCVDHNCGKFLEMGIPDHLTCLLRNLYAGQEATVRTGHGTTDWFQIGKGVCQGSILSPCLFNLYAEFSSVAQLCPTLCDPRDCKHQVSLSITNCWSLLKLESIESVMSSNHPILCHPLLLLPSTLHQGLFK